ncbi:MAG: Bug family tripartite tricarboxylate transporter substrate binding protein [Xanthobacteraceae bacterium]
MKITRSGLAALSLLLCAPALSAADTPYPTKPIRLVVPFAAGGPSDVIARIIAPKLSDVLGQSVIIDNRAGAGGTIGVGNVANSAPDGYSLVNVGPGPIVVSPYIAKTSYDPTKDLIPISQVAEVPVAIVASPKFAPGTFPELVAYAKANPGKVTFGSPGAGTLHHLLGELIKKDLGIDMVHVPYKGAAPAMNGLLSGDVDIAIVDASGALPQIKAKTAKLVALTMDKRNAKFPEYPVAAETGYPSIVGTSWYGLFAAAKTPPEIVAKLEAATRRAVADEGVRQRLDSIGVLPADSSSADFARFIAKETKVWGTLAKEIGVTLQ